MLDFFRSIENEFISDIGEVKLSPITKASLGLSLRYINSFKSDTEKHPLFICFPAKKNASAYISCGVLTNFFFYDYYDQNESRPDQLKLKPGTRIRIFGELTTWHNGKIEVMQACRNEFGRIERSPVLFTLKKSYLSHINLDNSKATQIVSFEILNKRIQELRKNKNALSKILSEETELGINKGLLDSKVLLVTGRGNTGYLRTVLKEKMVYGETLSDIFSEGCNLLLNPDLEDYKALFDPAIEQKVRDYETQFNAIYQRYSGNGFPEQELLDELKKKVEQGQFQTEEFIQKYDCLIIGLSEEGPFKALIKLKEKHPGLLKSIDKFRAVVINDITLYELYKTTITGFLNRGIPVIVISDRNIDSVESASFYKTLFNTSKDAYRLNWNQKKVQRLIPLTVRGSDFIDNEVWQTACRYANQKIRLRTFNAGTVESITNALPKAIGTLEGFEKLKDSFWKHMFPALFIIKNTPGRLKTVQLLILEFIRNYEEVRAHLPGEFQKLIDSAVTSFREYTFNEKLPEEGELLYYQELGDINGLPYSIPFTNTAYKKTSTLTEYTKEIVFTGFPYKEWSYHILSDAVCSLFVPDIKLLLWPKESITTDQYIRTRVAASYFSDKVHNSWQFPADTLLLERTDIQKEIDELIGTNHPETQPTDSRPDFNFGYDPRARHRWHVVDQQHAEESYSVKCNVLHFEEEEFMYLPYTSTVMAMVDSLNDKIRLRKCHFNELATGYTIFVYRLDRSMLRELARNNPKLSKAFSTLEIWKGALKQSYKSVQNNMARLEKLLSDEKTRRELKGNPSRSNIRRWLFDDDMIAPEEDNLKIILHASGIKDVNSCLNVIEEAVRDITGFSISISHHIQDEIIKYISRNRIAIQNKFETIINGIRVQVESRTIIGLEKNDYQIDYSDTRKIIK